MNLATLPICLMCTTVGVLVVSDKWTVKHANPFYSFPLTCIEETNIDYEWFKMLSRR